MTDDRGIQKADLDALETARGLLTSNGYFVRATESVEPKNGGVEFTFRAFYPTRTNTLDGDDPTTVSDLGSDDGTQR